MNRFKQIALLTIALGAMAAAQAPVPPAPPTPAPPAVPARPAKPARPAVPAKGASYLGVDIRDVTHDNMAALKLKEARGVEITMVDGDAPAGKAGLKERDVILSFNGRNIQSSEELRTLIHNTPPGQAVELGISRDGRPMTVKAQLADRRNFLATTRVTPNIHIRGIPRIDVPAIMVYPRRNGIVVENLTPQLGEVFGVKDGEGVLVRSVEKDSAGDLAGLRAGDVIVRVGSEPVADASEWNRLMREQKPGPVQLGIIRDKRQQSISVTLPERSHEQSNAFPGMEGMDMEEFGRNMQHSLQDLNRLSPEIQRAMREAQEKIRREFERSQRELERSQREQERAQREAERAQERAQQQAERVQRDAERQQERAQREAERARERAQQQAERAREQAEREQERAQEQAERDREKSVPPEAPPAPAKPPAPPQ